MANTRAGSVLICDTTGTVNTGPTRVSGILYVPGTGSPTSVVSDIAGVTLWEASGATRVFDEAELRSDSGLQITLAGTGTKLYIYLDV
jgi:hypothetical protein